MSAGYKDTILLPKTEFPQQANLVKMEPLLRERWEKQDLYGRIRKARQGRPKRVLHDGPPYANGDVHVGTGQNKILKDMVVKYWTMRGFDSPYVPGWDCHGLPIEHKVVKELGEKAKTTSKSEIRRLCREFATKWIDIQRRQFKSLGVLGDWERPYLTLSPDYEVGIVEVFEDLWKKGHVTRRKKSITWCIFDRTALAEAELEYKTRTDLSIYAAFAVAGRPDEDLLVWTTTPWTLPGNVAVAVHPTVDYVRVKRGARTGWLAKPLYEKRRESLKLGDVVEERKGSDLCALKYAHPLFGRECPVVGAEYVTVEDGTGLVHTAPGHGAEDYETGLRYKLPILSPVDEGGFFTEEAGEWKGQRVFDANAKIVDWLRARGTLVLDQAFEHEYPCCWRCKNPVIFRATEQWFISVDANDGRKRALDEVRKTRWVPAWGETRLASMLEQRPDWCVSRQRTWGVPIPAFYCTSCGREHLSEASFAAVKKLFAERGADAWFSTEPKDYLPPAVKCPCGGASFRPEQDIFDVWFESGCSHRGVLMKHPDLTFPAEAYLEGTDQHRGWFQVSLLASLLSNGSRPFNTVITHGFLVDARTGDKLSKSGFLIPADEVVSKIGADLLRLWIASIDFTDDLPMSWEILKEKAEPYKKIRNTLRWLLGATSDYEPSKPPPRLEPVDEWARAELARVVREVTDAYDRTEFFRAMKALNDFCVVTLSATYFDILKDRLYTLKRDDPPRRSAQFVLREILAALLRMYAPVLVHTCEEAWGYLPGSKEESVHVALWPEVRESAEQAEVRGRFERLLAVRGAVNKSLEKLRAAGTIGKSLEARVHLHAAKPETAAALRGLDLEEFFMVSEVLLVNAPPGGATEWPELPGLFVSVERSPHPKCARCWNLRATVGSDNAHLDLCGRCVKAIK